MRRPAEGESRSSGFILVPVIWVVFLLALATATFTLTTRSNVQTVASATSSASAMALADAGVNLALYDLANARAVRGWKSRFGSDGRTFICTIGAARVGITINDEAGKIDLNGADRSLLVALLHGLGAPIDQARRLAAAIEDYRDPDDTRAPDGAERTDYREAGRPSGPKNAAFESALELAQVLGFDRSLLDKVLPYVTVHTGLTGFDPTKAPPALLDILTGGFGDRGTGSSFSPASRFPAGVTTASNQRVHAITAQSIEASGAKFAREAVVSMSASGSEMFAILDWRQVGASDTLEGADLGPC